MNRLRVFSFLLIFVIVVLLIFSAIAFSDEGIIRSQKQAEEIDSDELLFLQWEYRAGDYPKALSIGRKIVAIAYEDELVMLLTHNGSVVSRLEIRNVTNLKVGDYNKDGSEDVVISRINDTLVIDIHGNIIGKVNASGLIVNIRPLIIINSSYIFIQSIGYLNNPASALSRDQVVCADVDKDGEAEVVFRANGYLYMVNGADIKRINSEKLSGSDCLALGDFDEDGEYEIITQDEGYLVIMKLNGSIVTKTEVERLDRFKIGKISVGDIDYDGSDEAVFDIFGDFGTFDIKDGVKYYYIGIADEYLEQFIIADLDGDGFVEFMIIGLNGLIPMYDYYGENHYTYLDYYYSDPYAIWDFDNDTKLEIIVPYQRFQRASGVFCFELYRSRPIIQWWGSNGSPDNLNVGLIDSDRDGLSDYSESIIGSDPLNPDTDGDSIKDSLEIVYGSNPLNNGNVSSSIDSDMDGLYDYKERLIGTNPYDRDSDDDGFIDGIDIAPLNPLIPRIYILLVILLILGILMHRARNIDAALIISNFFFLTIVVIMYTIYDAYESAIIAYLEKFLNSINFKTAIYYISIMIVLIVLANIMRKKDEAEEEIQQSKDSEDSEICVTFLIFPQFFIGKLVIPLGVSLYMIFDYLSKFFCDLDSLDCIPVLMLTLLTIFAFSLFIAIPIDFSKDFQDDIKESYAKLVKECKSPTLFHLLNLILLFPSCMLKDEKLLKVFEKYKLARKLLMWIVGLAVFFSFVGFIVFILAINLLIIVPNFEVMMYVLAGFIFLSPLIILIIIIRKIFLMNQELELRNRSLLDNIIKQIGI